MSIESIIERPPMEYTAKAGQVTSVVGNAVINDALAGGTFGTDFATSDLIFWINDAGVPEFHVVQSVAANAITMYGVSRTLASGGASNNIYKIDRMPDYFVPVTTYPQAVVHAGFNSGGVLPNDILQTEDGKYKIDSNEGVLVKSVFIRMPYQYTWADGVVSVEIGYLVTGAAGAPLVVTQIGEDGVMNMPVENIEIPVNQYVPPIGVSGQTWQFYGKIGNTIPTVWSGTDNIPNYSFAQMSTVDGPAILEYRFQPVTVGMRILHAATALTT